jgi:hypothetical protein
MRAVMVADDLRQAARMDMRRDDQVDAGEEPASHTM